MIAGLDFSSTGEWMKGGGPDGDVVISTRVRIARNLSGFRFANRADNGERQQILAIARKHVGGHIGPFAELVWIDVNAADSLDSSLLVERHLVSKQFAKDRAPRALVISPDESLSIMINEEDHFRIQVIHSGHRVRAAFDLTNRIDDDLGSRVPYAYHKRFGYLTACPTNVGTGIRFSIMLHLPALMLTNEIERVRRAAQEMHLAVRGFYGEGSDVLGDFFQISNQTSLGRSEAQFLQDFDEQIMPRVIEYERHARRILLERRSALLDDRCQRALGILRSARLIKLDEALRLLSHLRLGVQLGRITDVDPGAVDRLLVMVQPAHLQKAVNKMLSPADRAQARATLIRSVLIRTDV